MTQPAPPAPAGVIHSLQYERYRGARLGPSTRFLVIARYALAMSWRLRVVKLFMLGGLMAAGIGSVVVGFMWGTTAMLGRVGGGAIPLSTEGLAVRGALTAQWLPSVLLVLVCGAPSIASDLGAGAFQFHFARPVSAGQYLAGRLLSAIAWAALFGYGTLVVFAVEQFAFSHDLALLARSLGVGAAAVSARLLTLGAVALGCSSLTRRRGLAQAMFVAVVFGSGMLASLAAANTRRDWVDGLSVMGSTTMVSQVMMGASELHGWHLATSPLAALGWSLGFLAIAWSRVSRAEVVRG